MLLTRSSRVLRTTERKQVLISSTLQIADEYFVENGKSILFFEKRLAFLIVLCYNI